MTWWSLPSNCSSTPSNPKLPRTVVGQLQPSPGLKPVLLLIGRLNPDQLVHSCNSVNRSTCSMFNLPTQSRNRLVDSANQMIDPTGRVQQLIPNPRQPQAKYNSYYRYKHAKGCKHKMLNALLQENTQPIITCSDLKQFLACPTQHLISRVRGANRRAKVTTECALHRQIWHYQVHLMAYHYYFTPQLSIIII